MSDYCVNCGSKEFGGACVNCHEETYIMETNDRDENPVEFSKGFHDKVNEQSVEIGERRERNEERDRERARKEGKG